MSVAEVARRSLEIAARLCIYTNSDITVEEVRLSERAVAAGDGARPA
jgi:ATP-dependent protease HslVU (ClpYQ) peptidase subunit